MPAVADPAAPAARARRAFPWGVTVLVAVLGVFAVGVVRLFELRFDVGDVYPAYSTLRSDPLGAKAFFASIDALPGRRAERSLQPLAALGTEPLRPADHDNGERDFTVFYLGANAWDWPYLFDPEAVERLETIMRRGGRVVITFKSTRSVPTVESLTAARSFRDRANKSGSRQGPAGRRLAKRLAAPDLGVRWGIDFRRQQARADAKRDENDGKPKTAKEDTEPVEYATPDPALTGRGGADGAFAADREAVPWHSALDFRTGSVPAVLLRWHRLYERRGQPVIVSRPVGLAGGELILVGDTYFLSNEGLRDDPSPALLAALVGGGRRVFFDESHLGVNEEPGLVTLARRYRLQGAIAALGLLVALFVWRAVVSLVPTRAAAGGDPAGAEVVAGNSAGSGYLNLLRRSVRPRDLPATCLAQWEKEPHPAAVLARVRAVVSNEAGLPARRRSGAATLYRAMCAAARKSDGPRQSSASDMTKTILFSAVLFLASLGWARAGEPFCLSSPDQKFEAIYAPLDEPPFAIAEKSTHKLVAAMDDERVGNHGVTATWAPDSEVLVVLVEWRLFTEIHVFRLRGGHFDRTQGPQAPENFLTLDRWVALDKVQMKGERKSYTLRISDHAAKFER